MRKYDIKLSDSVRDKIIQLLDQKKLSLRERNRCKVLLLVADGKKVEEIVRELDIGTSLIHRVRKRYVKDGLDMAIFGKFTGSTQKHKVKLTSEERIKIEKKKKGGCLSESELRRSEILILADRGCLDLEIVDRIGVSISNVMNIRKRYATEGLEVAIHGRPVQGPKFKLSQEECLSIKNLALSPAPSGEERWTLKLLANRLVQDGLVEKISIDTVRRSLMRVGVDNLEDIMRARDK